MKRSVLISTLVFCFGYLSSQNLIQNPSFEDTLVGSFGLISAPFWDTPSLGSSDFIHPATIDPFKAPSNIGGFQNAKKYDGYYGISVFSRNRTNSREYIQNELLSPLVKDSSYCIQFYLSLGDSMRYALKNKLGVYFATQKLNFQIQTTLPLIPVINFNDTSYFVEKREWIKVSSSYKAIGGEQFIIIGHFENDRNIDTLQINGGDKSEHKHVYYYLDDFYLGHCDSVPIDSDIGLFEFAKKKETLAIYPNPNTGTFRIKNVQDIAVLSIYSIQGKLLQEINSPQKTIRLKAPIGLYLVVARLKQGGILRKKIVLE